jgi:hypothetical protein
VNSRRRGSDSSGHPLVCDAPLPSARPLLARVPILQGLYFVATGMWPVLSRRSFERVTGPKADFWLAQTVGVLVTGIGTVILVAERRRRITPEIQLLAVASATGLALVDVAFVARNRISKVYLLDALAEASLTAGWLARKSQG